MQNFLINKINNVDWEFLTDDTRYDTHDFHRYSSKFIPQIASNLIKIFSKPRETVLDVFLGSGTTCVEAKLLNRESIGVDLNPIAYLISVVKTTPISNAYLNKNVEEILRKMRNDTLNKKKIVDMPSFNGIDRWFQPQVLNELFIIQNIINKIEDKKIKMFFVCGFSAILRSVSNAHTSYGNLMIDKKRRKITNTFEIFEKQINIMAEGMSSFNKRVSNSKSKIYCADSRNLSFIKNASVDLIVTHPPYISAVPYAEYQKLSLNWLENSFSDVFEKQSAEYLNANILDKELIGGRRNRQDVKERFISSMDLVFKEMHRVLKRDKYCCVVIGHPTVHGKIIHLSNELKALAIKNGFTETYKVTRGNHRTTMGKMKEEYILILKKTKKVN